MSDLAFMGELAVCRRVQGTAGPRDVLKSSALPCWRRYPGLAAELAVQVGLWYFARLDPTPPHRRWPATTTAATCPDSNTDSTGCWGSHPGNAAAASTLRPGARRPTSAWPPTTRPPADPDEDERRASRRVGCRFPVSHRRHFLTSPARTQCGGYRPAGGSHRATHVVHLCGHTP